jgi:hypothetical protein
MNDKLPIIDGVKWHIYVTTTQSRYAQPLCPQHNMRLQSVQNRQVVGSTGRRRWNLDSEATTMTCTDGQHNFELPRQLKDEQRHVINKIDALNFAKMTVINLDDAAIPVAVEELKDSDHWVKSKVTKSKTGDRLIIWAGNRSMKNKTQLFVEPALKRLSFDHNDDHPTEVFAKVEVTFANGVKSSLHRGKDEKTPK